MSTKAQSAASSQRRKRSVLVVDHHPVVRDGVVARLNGEKDFSVCCQVETAFEAQQALHRYQPDLMVMELDLPDRHGLEFVKDVRAQFGALQIVLFTTRDESIFALRALRAGANGYVTKHESTGRLLEALRLVVSGNLAVSPEVLTWYLQNPHQADAIGGDTTMFTRLTDRELEVFELIGKGAGTQEIAAYLHRSVSAVETCRLSIKEKLQLRDCAELVCRAIRWIDGRNNFPKPIGTGDVPVAS